MNKKQILLRKENDLKELEDSLKKVKAELKILKDLKRNGSEADKIAITEMLKYLKKRSKNIRKQIRKLKGDINLMKEEK
ncbi:MAG: hypothetical protein QG648_191 [Patescibacteria group bacterium]|nr:hypothetical protein [Patescibacteria group bacterium]